jgi:hypothetical protein
VRNQLQIKGMEQSLWSHCICCDPLVKSKSLVEPAVDSESLTVVNFKSSWVGIRISRCGLEIKLGLLDTGGLWFVSGSDTKLVGVKTERLF